MIGMIFSRKENKITKITNLQNSQNCAITMLLYSVNKEVPG